MCSVMEDFKMIKAGATTLSQRPSPEHLSPWSVSPTSLRLDLHLVRVGLTFTFNEWF
jgi:hypothetical protein